MEPKRIKDCTIYEELTIGDLHNLRSEGIISWKEFYDTLFYKQLKKDSFHIYLKKDEKNI